MFLDVFAFYRALHWFIDTSDEAGFFDFPFPIPYSRASKTCNDKARELLCVSDCLNSPRLKKPWILG